MLIQIILGTILVSLVSFVGIIISHNKIKQFIHYFISFAAATLISAAFFDLIPHGLEKLGGHFHEGLAFVVIGLVIFFIVEKFIHWHHCGKEDCNERPSGVLILVEDFVHNFIDGLLVAGAVMIDTVTGIVTTITIILHEIPQEFGDFAVLIHSGYSKMKALKMNFLSALSAVVGGIVGYFALSSVEGITLYLVLIQQADSCTLH